MFGIGLPELIVIMAVALIVVGPDKLPDLARSLAKGVMELKKTMNQLKEGLAEEGNTLDEVKSDLQKTAGELKEQLLDEETKTWRQQDNPQLENAVEQEVIDLAPIDERPWEADRKKEPDHSATASTDGAEDSGAAKQKTAPPSDENAC